MDIAILGAGRVGATLGRRWAGLGHRIIYGVRDPGRPKIAELLEASGPNASAETVEDAARAAPIIVLATPWSAVQEVVTAAGSLRDKIVVDCTNPLGPDLAGVAVGSAGSGGEQVARWARGARLVKAFNTTGSANMADPVYEGRGITMFVCGDDADAKQTVTGLASDLGFEVLDAGGLDVARHLESLAALWIHLAYRVGFGPDIAFELLRR